MKRKTIIFLGDGMADEPIPALNGKTPLQYANTPGMDYIAANGRSGTLLTLPSGFPTSSEVANMSVLGCDLATEYCGRGPLEAAGKGINLAPTDVAFRLNLTSVRDGKLVDFSGGHVEQKIAERLIAELQKKFGNNEIKFYAGVSYRNILVFSGAKYSHRVKTEKPDDNHGNPVSEHMPVAEIPEAEETAAILRRFIVESTPLLENCPCNKQLKQIGKIIANSIWPWSGGKAGAIKKLKDKYGITGAVISAVDVIRGLGKCIGMDVISVPGATGYIDTNYEGKAKAAIEAIEKYDLVYLHLEAIDEVSHEQNLDLKIKAIEDFDRRIITPVISAISKDVALAVLPDHPVPIATGKHTRTPVPVAVYIPGNKPDAVKTFDEIAAQKGMLGRMTNGDFMSLLFGKD